MKKSQVCGSFTICNFFVCVSESEYVSECRRVRFGGNVRGRSRVRDHLGLGLKFSQKKKKIGAARVTLLTTY